MIIQRIASALRRQDWFQVVIEVLIVIVGIFLGLQVQNWYEDQANKTQEEIYVSRMHEELMDVLNNFERASTLRLRTLQGLDGAMPLIAGDEKGELTQAQCNAIMGAHVYVQSPIDMPLITELLASGRLSIISNERLKTLISRMVINQEYSDNQLDNLRSDKLDLVRKYPNLIKMKYLNDENSLAQGINLTCDLAGMSNNQAFINDYLGARLRFGTFAFNIRIQSDLLNELHNELDRILMINHEETAQ